jgi:hypothetical protein
MLAALVMAGRGALSRSLTHHIQTVLEKATAVPGVESRYERRGCPKGQLAAPWVKVVGLPSWVTIPLLVGMTKDLLTAAHAPHQEVSEHAAMATDDVGSGHSCAQRRRLGSSPRSRRL